MAGGGKQIRNLPAAKPPPPPKVITRGRLMKEYERVQDFCFNNLEMYQNDLAELLYPLFVHVFLHFIRDNQVPVAHAFFAEHRAVFEQAHRADLEDLSAVSSREQLSPRSNTYVARMAREKCVVSVTGSAYALFARFLDVIVADRQAVRLRTHQEPGVNDLFSQYVTVTVRRSDRVVPAATVGDGGDGGAARLATQQQHRRRSRRAISVTAAVGGVMVDGVSMAPVRHSVGVLPVPPGAFGRAGADADAGAGAAGIGSSSGAGSSSALGAAGGGVGGSGPIAGSGSSAGAGSGLGAGTGSGSGLGAGAANEVAGGKGMEPVRWGVLPRGDARTSSVLARSRRRRRVLTGVDPFKPGPLVDYNTAYGRDVLARLVGCSAAHPDGKFANDDADRKACVPLDTLADLSAVCFTILNARSTAVAATLSADATMCAVGFDDSAVRVWRVDRQPLGTAAGFAFAAGGDGSAAGLVGAAGAGAHAGAGSGSGSGSGSGMGSGSGLGSGSGAAGSRPPKRRRVTLSGRSVSSRGARASASASASSPAGAAGAGASSNDEDDEARSATLIGHSGPVFALAFSPSNLYLLTGGEDTTIRMWDLASRSCLTVFRGHRAPVWQLRFAPHGHYFTSASRDCTVRMWACDRPSAVRVFVSHLRDTEASAVHPNLHYVLTGSADHAARLFRVSDGKCVRVLCGHTAPLTDVAFTPDGQFAAASAADGRVMLWHMGTGDLRCTLAAASASRIHSIDISADGSMLVAGHHNCTLSVWDLDVALHGYPPLAERHATGDGSIADHRGRGRGHRRGHGRVRPSGGGTGAAGGNDGEGGGGDGDGVGVGDGDGEGGGAGSGDAGAGGGAAEGRQGDRASKGGKAQGSKVQAAGGKGAGSRAGGGGRETNGHAGGGGDAAPVSRVQHTRTVGRHGVVVAPSGPVAAAGSGPAPSVSLLHTFGTKRTPVFCVRFTPRNLLLVAGPYHRTTAPVAPTLLGGPTVAAADLL